jgi:hypothetical protein
MVASALDHVFKTLEGFMNRITLSVLIPQKNFGTIATVLSTYTNGGNHCKKLGNPPVL